MPGFEFTAIADAGGGVGTLVSLLARVRGRHQLGGVLVAWTGWLLGWLAGWLAGWLLARIAHQINRNCHS
jgi:hypothetical protein